MKALFKRPLILLVAVTILVHVGVSVITYENFNNSAFADKDILSVCSDIILK